MPYAQHIDFREPLSRIHRAGTLEERKLKGLTKPVSSVHRLATLKRNPRGRILVTNSLPQPGYCLNRIKLPAWYISII